MPLALNESCPFFIRIEWAQLGFFQSHEYAQHINTEKPFHISSFKTRASNLARK